MCILEDKLLSGQLTECISEHLKIMPPDPLDLGRKRPITPLLISIAITIASPPLENSLCMHYCIHNFTCMCMHVRYKPTSHEDQRLLPISNADPTPIGYTSVCVHKYMGSGNAS